MIDARISIGLPSHPKTKKLIRRIGTDGAWRLVCLFLWAAQNRPDGDLSGLSTEDVELSVDWGGEHGKFVDALIQVGFLEGEEQAFIIHDWNEHNPWAAGSEARSEKARWIATCKHHGREKAAELMPEYAARLPKPASSMQQAEPKPATSMLDDATRCAPSPSPSPSPLPKSTEPKGSGENPPVALTSEEIIFGYGVPLLTNSGTAEKQARSFLGGLRKEHGDTALIDKLRECLRAKPLQPIQWLAAALPPGGRGKQAKLESRNAAAVSDWQPPEMREQAA